MGVEDEFCSVHRQSLLDSHAELGPAVLDGYTKEYLKAVPVTARTQLKKSYVSDYTSLWEFILEAKDFGSPACHAFGRFVEEISHTFQSGRSLKSDLEVININGTCAFAPPRVKQIWEATLKSVAVEDLKDCVDAVWGLELYFRYGLGPYPEFKLRFDELKAVWHDAVQRENGIVIARW